MTFQPSVATSPPTLPDSTPPLPPISAETPAAKAGPSNLRLRVIWGVIGAALLLGSVWFSPWTFGLFFAVVQAIMLWEFYRMMRAGGYAPATWLGVGASLLLFAVIHAWQGLPQYWHAQANNTYVKIGNASVAIGSGASPEQHMVVVAWALAGIAAILLVLFLILVLREIFLWPSSPSPFVNVAITVGGIFYISIPISLLQVIAYNQSYSSDLPHYDYRRIFALLFLIWASDIGAYAVGRAIGKHKFAPSISPGKTWEGWAGGFVMTLVVGWAIGYMLPDMPLTHRLVAAGVVAVFAPLGDLAESMLKRSVGVKDSGSIMPGHGGLLDRFDAFLLVLPVLALLQLLVG
ncbi:phosphatidate cytidylyltransferase [Hymenobacter terricola]|uniref:phosphatidate cytidylyltransferase n=1 Tax=Hymenobacter terricola TaxID=2819236 RepID=UPI001CF4ADF8|nr:phosphatidate cytidylyltransferase [Hymenobacter terricola]